MLDISSEGESPNSTFSVGTLSGDDRLANTRSNSGL